MILSARTASEIGAVAEEIRAMGGQAVPIPVDLASDSEIDALFAQVRARAGRLDILVNNAAVGLFGPLSELSFAMFDAMMAVNLRAPFLCCQHALKFMQAQRSGYIINISSVVGFKGYARQSAYTAAKHGIMGLTSLWPVRPSHSISGSASFHRERWIRRWRQLPAQTWTGRYCCGPKTSPRPCFSCFRCPNGQRSTKSTSAG